MFKKILLGILFVVVIGTVALLVWFKISWQNGDLQNKIVASFIPGLELNASSTLYFQQAAGFHGARTYLVLFLNNTELRPAGGFIGSYAIVKVENGKPAVLKVEGTEIIDNASAAIGITPPKPLADYLKISKWQFRDSNWSPDFGVAARFALERYKAERGYLSDEIDGVVGITPTVFEQLLAITGPVTVNNLELNSDNFTEKVEYEVEYGYASHGVSFSERKQFLDDLSKALGDRILSTLLTHGTDYLSLVTRMLTEKHILLYSTYPEEERFVSDLHYGGTMANPNSDYLLWVDANLGALKTDSVIDRSLSYQVKEDSGQLFATAAMQFRHTGGFSWRTTRYRDYARIFVPLGSTLIKVSGNKIGVDSPRVDSGVENGKQWFGTFVSITPGTEATLSFSYRLPASVVDSLKNQNYSLLIQKQAGTLAPQLTLHLTFDKKLKGAVPAEAPDRFGDNAFDLATTLQTDRTFSITLSQ